jgi:patched 1 protein/patched 2 protein
VYRFGGIPRKEFVTISSSSSQDGQLDLKKSMDALTLALDPIYSNLSMEHSVGNSTIILTNVRSFSLSLSLNYFT